MADQALAGILILFLLLAFIGDLLQFAVRIIASIIEHPNLSTHLVSLSMLPNRVGAAGALLVIGYSVDKGLSQTSLIHIYIIFSILLGLTYLVAALFRHRLLGIFIPFINRYYGVQAGEIDQQASSTPWYHPKPDIALMFALAICGFLLPSVAAATFPDYRATLLQTGFILNSFVTLYFALKIEKELAITLNIGSQGDKWRSYNEFMVSRAIGCIISAAIFASVLLFV